MKLIQSNIKRTLKELKNTKRMKLPFTETLRSFEFLTVPFTPSTLTSVLCIISTGFEEKASFPRFSNPRRIIGLEKGSCFLNSLIPFMYESFTERNNTVRARRSQSVISALSFVFFALASAGRTKTCSESHQVSRSQNLFRP